MNHSQTRNQDNIEDVLLALPSPLFLLLRDCFISYVFLLLLSVSPVQYETLVVKGAAAVFCS